MLKCLGSSTKRLTLFLALSLRVHKLKILSETLLKKASSSATSIKMISILSLTPWLKSPPLLDKMSLLRENKEILSISLNKDNLIAIR